MLEHTSRPCKLHHRQRHNRSRHRSCTHGRRHRHRLPPLHQKRHSASSALHSTSSDVEATQTNQQSGCGLIMTEFTSQTASPACANPSASATSPSTRTSTRSRHRSFGSNPETLAESARIVQDAGFDLRRPQPRLPRQARRRLQRRLRPLARSPADRAHLQGHPRSGHHSSQ